MSGFSHRLQRSLWAFFLGLLVLSTGMESHSVGEGLKDSPFGQTFVQAATVHSESWLHIEAALPTTVPPCPACLLHLRASGAHHTPVAGLETPTLSNDLICGRVWRYQRDAVILHSDRGPPTV